MAINIENFKLTMKKYLQVLLLLCTVSSCAYNDITNNLRYADNRRVGISEINFQELSTMKKGQSCGYTFLYFFPLFDNRSIISATSNADISRVQYIGETHLLVFPLSRKCSVVYGN